MSELSIAIFKHADADSRVAARVRRVADLDGTSVSGWSRDVRVSSHQERSLEVEPGRYVVETFWRDGRMTSQFFMVEPDSASAVQLVPPVGGMTPAAAPRDFTKPSASGMFRPTTNSSTTYSVFAFDLAKDGWTGLVDRTLIGARSKISPDSWPTPRSSDVALKLEDRTKRNWVMYWASDFWAVSSIPSNPVEEETAVLRSSPLGVPFVAVSDPDFTGMTDLLPAGNSEAAHRYASTTPTTGDLISSKPFELCAFAYAEYENFGANLWMEALELIVDREAWLCDVSILLGWRRLMTASSEDDWSVAGILLERAFETGVPYYSLGVKLLADGLTMLSKVRPQHEASARLVRSLALRTVPTEAFTTVRL